MSEGFVHTAGQGDSTTRIAFRNGFFWKTVWEHSENSELKSLRKDPNILLPGDTVFVPELRKGQESAATEKRHRYRRKGVPEYLNVQFFDLYGRPFANKPFTLTIDKQQFTGNLDGDGWLRHPISPDAQEGLIKIGKNGELAEMRLNLGHLDPVSEITGVKGRLRNIGYYKGPIDNDTSTEEFARACRTFRLKEGLAESDEIDDAFRDALVKRHNS